MNSAAPLDSSLPPDRARRNPLLSEAGWAHLARILEDEHAPRWNAAPGDGVQRGDLEAVAAFRTRIADLRAPEDAKPHEQVLRSVAHALAQVPLLRERLRETPDPWRHWHRLPTTSREDLATRMEEMVPDDADISRITAHETSGATGHAIHVPTHPQAIAMGHVLVERVLAAVGAGFRPGRERLACVNLCARSRTWVFPTVFSVWGEAGFAKLNLADADWPGGREAARAFFRHWRPALWTGDPVAFAEALAWDLPGEPVALLSTSTALERALATAIVERYRCPLIDWYSTTETGPIAWRAAGDEAFAPISPDLFVELLDAVGNPVPEGARGEITVSGGRNPFLPLVRYRTGDTARFARGRGPTPLLAELEGRRPVRFSRPDGGALDAADVGRELRSQAAFAQHACVQHADGSLEIRMRPLRGVDLPIRAVEDRIRDLLGPGARVSVLADPTLGASAKVVPYRCEAPAQERG